MLGSSSSHGGLQTIKRNILQISVTAYISSHIIPAWCQLEVLIHLADKNLSNEWMPVTIMSLHKTLIQSKHKLYSWKFTRHFNFSMFAIYHFSATFINSSYMLFLLYQEVMSFVIVDFLKHEIKTITIGSLLEIQNISF